eukprot:181013-Chlamydomonas_euryale.AAC.1
MHRRAQISNISDHTQCSADLQLHPALTNLRASNDLARPHTHPTHAHTQLALAHTELMHARAELMHVLPCCQVEPVALTGEAAKEWGPCAYETEILLVTGRTHQVCICGSDGEAARSSGLSCGCY